MTKPGMTYELTLTVNRPDFDIDLVWHNLCGGRFGARTNDISQVEIYTTAYLQHFHAGIGCHDALDDALVGALSKTRRSLRREGPSMACR
jgi:hypothetical protein